MPARSPVKLESASTTFFSISMRYRFEIPGPRGKSARFLPTRILVLLIISASSPVKGGALILVASMSEECLSAFLCL